jgi:Skp family chaperone for outer membrane proteins
MFPPPSLPWGARLFRIAFFQEQRMLSRWSIPVVCTLLVCAGCSKDASVKTAAETPSEAPAAHAEPVVGGVGVVDLDVVATTLGRDREINQLVNERTRQLNHQLRTLGASLRRLIDEKKEQYGENPTDEQQDELENIEKRHALQLGERKRISESELEAYRNELVNKFRDEAKPYLQEVAAARGLSIVIPKNPGLLLAIDPKAEITAEVAARMPKAASFTQPEADESDEPQPERKAKKRSEADTSSR